MDSITSLIPRALLVKYTCCICLDNFTINEKILYQPCKKVGHMICCSCLGRSMGNLPIGLKNPVIKCFYPFSECESTYSDNIIKKILGYKYHLYKLLSIKYWCNTEEDDDVFSQPCLSCDNFIVIGMHEIYEIGHGINVFECDYCKNHVCIDCMRPMKEDEHTCFKCLGKNEYTNGNSYNYFFSKQQLPHKGILDFYQRNNTITKSSIYTQLLDKLKSDELYVICPVCKIKIKKTEQCNGIKHCHTEICYSCGMFSDPGSDLYDHWSANGVRGCPRWDTDPIFITEVPSFLCREGDCYDHELGDCKLEEHREGIKDKVDFLKKQHVFHGLKSVWPIKRNQIIDKLVLKGYGDYIPQKETFEFFDTCSDKAMRYNYLC